LPVGAVLLRDIAELGLKASVRAPERKPFKRLALLGLDEAVLGRLVLLLPGLVDSSFVEDLDRDTFSSMTSTFVELRDDLRDTGVAGSGRPASFVELRDEGGKGDADASEGGSAAVGCTIFVELRDDLRDTGVAGSGWPASFVELRDEGGKGDADASEGGSAAVGCTSFVELRDEGEAGDSGECRADVSSANFEYATNAADKAAIVCIELSSAAFCSCPRESPFFFGHLPVLAKNSASSSSSSCFSFTELSSATLMA